MGSSAEDRRLRALRSAKAAVDPWKPLAVVVEEERAVGGGGPVPIVAVFLAGQECPFSCVFCDLWQYTLERPTPAGAIPVQLETALEQIGGPPARADIKLYNASNFFDKGAVPPEDDPRLAELLRPFRRVIVECHPRFVGARCFEFARRLHGCLEVAMGLETVHPAALPRLNKKMTVTDFDRAAARLLSEGIGVRAFVLIGTPFVPVAEQVGWTLRSIAHALEQGAEVVSIIPLRPGNGEVERLAESGEWTPASLDQIEDCLEKALGLGQGVVQVDTWDLDHLPACQSCKPLRIERLRRINLTGRPEPRPHCGECRGDSLT